MKIAILTQPLHNNYGGNLQNFALQKVLKDMGHEPITIDRHHAIKLRTKLKLGYFKNLALHYIKGTKKPLWKSYFISKKEQNYIRENINSFIDTHINKTPRLYTDKAVQAAFTRYDFDAVIVGSDQVWRPMYSPNIYTYYLDFLKDNIEIKKIAYAASFGAEEWEYSQEQTSRCKELIQQFDLVTVREKSAVNLVAEKFNKDAQFVLDPTLLLSKEDYMELFAGKNLSNNKGMYTYILDDNDWKSQVVATVKETLGLPQFSNQHNEYYVNSEKIPSIEGWIKGFTDADFVITDSFHGTVFSILLNKPFVSLLNVDRGASRFNSILSEFGLEDRLVGYYDEDKISALLNQEIDWQMVNEKLEKLKLSSKVFCKSGLIK
tara:strand:- start:1003 stop:2133 length:1131 start_codon:yes stop_codon:yes gene_type:complete